jgi:hypothetical protein
MARGRRRQKPQGRFARWLERVALGAVMGAVAFVVERRLLRVIRGRDRDEREIPRGTGRTHPPDRGAELALASEQVDDQPAGQQATHDPQHRR